MKIRKWKLILIVVMLCAYGTYLWDDYKEPSDSGKMTWFTYLMIEHKARQGDGKAISHLAYHYEMDDSQENAEKISELLLSAAMNGYGGLSQGGEGITLSVIRNCAHLGSKGPERAARLFAAIRDHGGGLTDFGKDMEARWYKGDFPGCPPFLGKL